MKKILFAVALTSLVIGVSTAKAVETGMSIYPKGMVGFMSGLLPPQSGLYLTDTYYHFGGSAGQEVRNGVTELNVGINMDADFLQGTYVTDTKILGGTYAAAVAVAYAGANLHATVVTPAVTANVRVANNGFGDTIFVPIMLGWHEEKLHWTAGLSIYAPTGSYNQGELNLGRNVWGFWPQVGMTWFDPASGWDVSGTAVWVAMTNNDATDYQSGNLLHFDWAIGKHFGAWEAGIAGNLVQQINGDRGTGARLGSFEAQSAGIGPAINYMTKAGETPLQFGAKWEHDFGHQNTFGGDVMTVSITAVF
ncbi:MAG TPA: transporter [Rhizomicrobium sp.]|jgi:hypothetical protein